MEQRFSLSRLFQPQVLSRSVVVFSLLAVACVLLRSMLGLNAALALALAWVFIIIAALAAIALMLMNKLVDTDDAGDSKLMS